MAFELYRSNEPFRLRGMAWGYVLRLARMGGWEPAGTISPSGEIGDPNWEGRYDTNDGQQEDRSR